jgi:hypothetical protein
MPAGASWVLCKYWDKFSESQRNSLLVKLKSNSFNVVRSHGTENHSLIRNVGGYLGASCGQMRPAGTARLPVPSFGH